MHLYLRPRAKSFISYNFQSPCSPHRSKFAPVQFLISTSQKCETALTLQNLFICLSFCVDITLTKCLKSLKYPKSLFVSKFQSGTQSLTNKGRFWAARTAKKTPSFPSNREDPYKLLCISYPNSSPLQWEIYYSEKLQRKILIFRANLWMSWEWDGVF